MAVTSVAGATTKFTLGTWDCTVDSDVGTCGFSLELGIVHVCGHAHVRSYVSPGMDCVHWYIKLQSLEKWFGIPNLLLF